MQVQGAGCRLGKMQVACAGDYFGPALYPLPTCNLPSKMQVQGAG